MDDGRQTADGGEGQEGASLLAGASLGRKIGIGCFTAWLGLVSGAMVAALLSKFAAFVTKSTACPDIPSCNWYVWAGVGGVIGAVTLPVLVLMKLGKPAKNSNPDRGM